MTNQTALYDRLSPYEMVKYFADLNSMDKSVFDKRCKDIFDRLNMNTFANKRIGTLLGNEAKNFYSSNDYS